MVMVVSSKRRLTAQQRAVLADIHTYRFVTGNLLASRLNLSPVTMRRSLPLLLHDGYLGRHYDASYRLAGRPAAYYVTPSGLRMLQSEPSRAALREVYRNRTASLGLIARCVGLQQLERSLCRAYGDRLRYFSKQQLRAYSYFPQPLPDGFVTLSRGGNMQRMFVEYVAAGLPGYALTRRLQVYIAYAESGEWEDTGEPLPELLLLCADDQTVQRMRRIMRRLAYEIEDSELRIRVIGVRALDKTVWPNIVQYVE